MANFLDELNQEIPCFRFSAVKRWALNAYTVTFYISGDHRYIYG